jgi:hypothetical protein
LLCSLLRSFYVGQLPFRRRRDLLRLYMTCERCETQNGTDEQNMTKDHAHSPLDRKLWRSTFRHTQELTIGRTARSFGRHSCCLQ